MDDNDKNIARFREATHRTCSDCQVTGIIADRVETAGMMGSTTTRPCYPCQAAIVAAWPGAQQLLAEVDRLTAELVSTTDHLTGAMSVVRAELEHERRLTRRLATDNTTMATAIQRVRDLLDRPSTAITTTPSAQAAASRLVDAVRRALTGEGT